MNKCKHCNSERLVKAGFKDGVQKWRCKDTKDYVNNELYYQVFLWYMLSDIWYVISTVNICTIKFIIDLWRECMSPSSFLRILNTDSINERFFSNIFSRNIIIWFCIFFLIRVINFTSFLSKFWIRNIPLITENCPFKLFQ